MNFNSPVYSWKNNQPVVRGGREDEFRSPFTSPQDKSPGGFSPYGSSSPNKQHRGPKRYFNNSNSSPYKQHNNRNNRDHFKKGGRGSTDSPNISLYYDPSAVENPWAELEREYEERKEKEKLKISPTVSIK